MNKLSKFIEESRKDNGVLRQIFFNFHSKIGLIKATVAASGGKKMDVKKEIFDEESEKNTEIMRIVAPDISQISKYDGKTVLKKIALGLFYILCGYLLGGAEIFFGALPFGIALLSAANHSVAYIYIGICLSAIFGEVNTTVFICAYSITVLLRILARIVIDNAHVKNSGEKISIGEIIPILFGEHICLRMASAALGAFIIGIFTLVEGGFYYYDLFGAIVGVVAAPLLTVIYYFSVGSETPSEKWGFLSMIALAASFTFATRELEFLGISVGFCVAMMLTLYFCRKRSLFLGLIAGAALGLSFSPILSPIFVLAALTEWSLSKVSSFFASLAALSVGLAWALFAEGISALTSVFPSLLLSTLIFSVIDTLYIKKEVPKIKVREKHETKKETVSTFVCRPLSEETISAVVLDDAEQRIKIMCETLSTLSRLFFDLSERMRNPASEDIKQICDSAFDGFCQGCEMRSICWEKEYAASLATISHLSSELVRMGHIKKDDIRAEMYERCHNMPSIIEQINRNCMLHTQQLIIGDKTEIFALDYEAMSELLASAMVDERQDFEPRPELTERLCARFVELGIEISGVIIYGGERRRRVILRAEKPSAIFSNLDVIEREICDICDEKLTLTSKKNDGRYAEAIFSVGRNFTVEYAKRSIKAEGEEGFCGDTVTVFENSSDKLYSFLSDGMGSGRDAALTSGICSVFLSKILTTTSRCEVSLAMLNGFLRNKGGGSMHECSATVDLLEFDLVSGEAAFYKGGAAPSYVLRDDNLYKLRSNSVPLGIIKELDTKKIALTLEDGDIVVMVSDGVTQAKDECPWLFDLLRASVGKESLASIADMIVKRAKYEGATDDISVVVMKILRI